MALKVISGGQTGVDQVALTVARSMGFETGGYAPKGWKTAEGPCPELAEFGLIECISEDYAVRTELNVEHSTATVWFGRTSTPGYVCTLRAVHKHGRPFITNPTAQKLTYWLWKNHVEVLNVAGNRYLENPTATARAHHTLQLAFTSPVLP